MNKATFYRRDRRGRSEQAKCSQRSLRTPRSSGGFFTRFERDPLLALFCLVFCLLSAACSRQPADDSIYVQEIAAARAAKDAAFRQADSPVPADRRAEFLPLSYFPPDPAYTVPAVLRLFPDPPVVRMPTSTGRIRAMQKVGALEFTLGGRPSRLSAFAEAGSATVDRLFVPFADQTSRTETYAAGRYLDLDRTATGIYVIDFNRAYHPFCYYNLAYDCPYPPAENRLPVAVLAGERLRPRPSTY